MRGHHDGFENTFDSARSDALHRSSTCRASREVRLAASANQMTLFTLIYLASVPIHTYRTMRRVLVERRRHLACLAFFGTTAASSRAARSGFKPDASCGDQSRQALARTRRCLLFNAPMRAVVKDHVGAAALTRPVFECRRAGSGPSRAF